MQHGISIPKPILHLSMHTNTNLQGRNITWQNQTRILWHPNIKGIAFNPRIFMLFNQDKLIFKLMHVHVNVWLTSLHHNTNASMHVHFHMHVHGIPTNQRRETETKGQIKGTQEACACIHIHTRNMRMHPNFIRTCTMSMCAHARNMRTQEACARIHTRNPNPETQNKKIQKIENLTT